MSADLAALAERLVEAGRAAGADAADAVAVAGDSLSIEVRGGALEHAERSEGVDLGLRVLVGRRQACVSASDTRPETIAAMAERAVAMAREAPEDPYCGLADPAMLARDWDVAALDLVDPEPMPGPEALQAAALAAEAAALAVPGVTRMRLGRRRAGRAGASTSRPPTASPGASAAPATRCRRWRSAAKASAWSATTPSRAAPTAATCPSPPRSAGSPASGPPRWPARASRRPAPVPVLYDERVASGLIGHLVQAINGSAITRGASWLKDAMGERVLPAGIDLVEDPLRPRIPGSRPFDGEGLPAVRRLLVEDGILRSWTLDLATGRQLGLPSTANAGRGTSSPPSPSAGNLTLTQGTVSRDDLIAEMGTGLVVTSLLGASINPTTGDYSRGASGFWVENGAIVRPVNECTIAGNLRAMLTSIRPANDARPWLGRVVPSLLVEGLVVAGS